MIKDVDEDEVTERTSRLEEGSELAEKLGYKSGTHITISALGHGLDILRVYSNAVHVFPRKGMMEQSECGIRPDYLFQVLALQKRRSGCLLLHREQVKVVIT